MTHPDIAKLNRIAEQRVVTENDVSEARAATQRLRNELAAAKATSDEKVAQCRRAVTIGDLLFLEIQDLAKESSLAPVIGA